MPRGDLRSTSAALLLFCATLLPTQLFASSGTLFVYHRFDEPRLSSTNIPLAIFAAQLEYLAHEKIPVLPLREVVSRLRSGASLPARYVVLTVDDAYRSFVDGAMPLLRRYRFPVTLFVSSASVGARGYLDWEELRSLQREGVEIGNHSHRHPHLVNLWLEQGGAAVRGELDRSQALFEKELGRRPRLFAYPFGETTPEITALVAEAGFDGAAVQHSGVVNEESDLMQLPRFAMGGRYATLEGLVEKSRLFALPVRVIAPLTPLYGGGNPPEVSLQLGAESPLGVGDLTCFVAGERACRVVPLPEGGGRFRVVADQRLKGRRNRYTLTARDAQGRWYWHTFLWIDPDQPE